MYMVEANLHFVSYIGDYSCETLWCVCSEKKLKNRKKYEQ